MQTTLSDQIKRAQELLKSVRHAAMATVNEDGSPHNTPFVFMRDSALEHMYWGSHPDSQHSINILRNGQLFVVLYEANERGGLYLQAEAGHIAEGEELETALAVHNQIRQAHGKAAIPLDYYTGDSPQKMWVATIKKLWVNGSQRDENDMLVKDVRTEVTAKDLLS
jgi:hypothetical protein